MVNRLPRLGFGPSIAPTTSSIACRIRAVRKRGAAWEPGRMPGPAS